MARKSNKWITYVAVLLIFFGFVEDITGVLLLLGILTSFAGVVLLMFKGFGRHRR